MDRAPEGRRFWRRGWGAALCVLHALLLACPLLHFFMHRDRH